MNIFLIALITSLLDIATKWWTQARLPNISLFGNWLQLTHIKNTGIAFSTPLPGIHIVIPLILGGLLFFVIKSWKHLSKQEKIGYSLILTGGFLNAVERSIFGFVTDMISVRYFAVFNVADIAVTFGVLFLLSSSILSRKKKG